MNKMMMMCSFFLVGLIVIGVNCYADNASNSKKKFSIETLTTLPESSVIIDGDSTLRKFSSSAKVIEMTAQLEKDQKKVVKNKTENKTKTENGTMEQKIKNILLKIKVSELKSDSTTLDDHLFNALKGEQFPQIEASIDSYKIEEEKNDGELLVEVVVDLVIAGEKRPTSVDAIITRENNKIHIKGEKKLMMTDFKVDPPTLMFGAIKVRNEINIRFNFVLGLKE